MILGTFNAVLVVKITPEDSEIDLRVITSIWENLALFGGVDL